MLGNKLFYFVLFNYVLLVYFILFTIIYWFLGFAFISSFVLEDRPSFLRNTVSYQ